jgi:putative acetyltransferase
MNNDPETTIRTAMPGDHDSILELVRDAFTSDDHDASEELDIVVSTRAGRAVVPELELVAVIGDVVVGHVMAGRGDIGGREAIAVAPLAVAPSHQGSGIGSAPYDRTPSACRNSWAPLDRLAGQPRLLRAFRLRAVWSARHHLPPCREGDPHFLVRRLAGYDPSYRGDFTYCWEARSG